MTAPGAIDVPGRDRARSSDPETPWWEPGQLSVLVADEDAAALAAARALIPAGAGLAECVNGAQALWLAGQRRPEVVVLSATLPVVPAAVVAEILAEHRAPGQTIVVGVGLGEADRAGPVLAAGAGAVVFRPYEGRDLGTVLGASLRDFQRRGREQAVLTVGALRLDGPAFDAWAGGRRLKLSLREFELLRLLMARAGEVVSQSVIRSEIWAAKGEVVSGNTIAVHVRRLRAHLTGTADITSVRGVGYRLSVRRTDSCQCQSTSEEW